MRIALYLNSLPVGLDLRGDRGAGCSLDYYKVVLFKHNRNSTTIMGILGRHLQRWPFVLLRSSRDESDWEANRNGLSRLA